MNIKRVSVVLGVVGLCIISAGLVSKDIVSFKKGQLFSFAERASAEEGFVTMGLDMNSCGKTVVDNDGNEYATVLIGSQCWMAENFRLGSQIAGSENQGNANNGNAEKYCYGDDPENCDTFGGLYQWHTVMAFPQSCDTGNAGCTVNANHQGVCPKGWHVPTDAEWHDLELTFSDPANCNLTHSNGNCDPAAQALKAAEGWNGQAGDNSSGFAGLPGGYRDSGDSQFYCNGDDECDSGHFWTASTPTSTARLALQHNLYLEDQEVHRGNYDKTSGFSLRCVRNN